jgi:hypothetical protein
MNWKNEKTEKKTLPPLDIHNFNCKFILKNAHLFNWKCRIKNGKKFTKISQLKIGKKQLL